MKIVFTKKYGLALTTQAISGEAYLIDIIRNSKEVFAITGNYHYDKIT